MRCFDEGSTEPGVALARLAALAFAGALVIAGAHTRPGGEVARGGEPGHIQPDLGDDGLSRASTDAWDRVQAVERVLKTA